MPPCGAAGGGYCCIGTERRRLYYESYNAGSVQKVLFVNGFACFHTAFEYQQSFLVARGVGVCVFDNCGIGRSDVCPGWRWTTTGLAADALALLNHLGWIEQVHVVGHSLGSLIAQELLALEPLRFASVTLIASRSGRKLPPLCGAMNLLCSLGADDPLVKINGILDANFPASFLDKLCIRSESGEHATNRDACVDMIIRRARGNRALQPGSLFKQFLAAITHYTPPERLKSLRAAPFAIMVVAGTEDRIHTQSMSEILAAELNAELKLVPDAGHSVHDQCPALVNHWLLEHINDASTKQTPSPV
jgi:pimeloyl-ACP methyl ester carboxylesterase